MEIDRSNFWEKLPTIFKAISEAEYVAVDLEMSGIHVHRSSPMQVAIKPTLQEAYGDARMAANVYSILQFGFTCIRWEPEKKSYVTKTFNVPLHPGVVGTDAASQQFASVSDHCFMLSTKTLAFLENNGFNFLDVFNRGVPYLSASNFNQQATSDFYKGRRLAENLIDVNELPTKSTEFRKDVEWKVMNWRAKILRGGQPEPVRIYSPHGHRLNGLQKRLVHQLLQDQWPDLQAVSRHGGTCMEIFHSSAQTSGAINVQNYFAVGKQIGASLLWDAICGQPFANDIELSRVVGTNPVKMLQMEAELKEYEARLRNRRPIVIGHNILMDLCFLHSSFVAPVPESLQEFRALTRARIPRIVDTKYLFTRGGDEMSPDYSLGESFAAVRSNEFPVVAPDPAYSYSKPRAHQAGYDSYMTAVVFLKKSYQLSQDREGLWYIAAEDLGEGEALRSSPFTSPELRRRQMTLTHLKARDEAPPPPLPPMPDVPEVPSPPLALRKKMAKSRWASVETLLVEHDDDVEAALAKFSILQPERRPTAPATAPTTPKQLPESKPTPTPTPKPEGGSPDREAVVPEWGSRFWSKYGNRSRVGQFGHILYIGKMAGERMPWEEGKTENLGAQMLEELARKRPDESEE